MIVLEVRIDEVNFDEAKRRAIVFLEENTAHTIFTPNPEILADAHADTYFREVLNSGSLNICDGMGIELVTHGKLKRIPGIDFILEICALAEQAGRGVYLLGSGNDEVLKMTKSRLLIKFPLLKIVGTDNGPKIKLQSYNLMYDKEENDKLLDDIIEKSPDILLVAFGHGKQEKWIYENLKHLPSVRIAMGVGGAFDVLSGKIHRAPRLLRRFGLEWLWRLLVQPSRIGRILKATIFFPYLFCKYNLSKTS